MMIVFLSYKIKSVTKSIEFHNKTPKRLKMYFSSFLSLTSIVGLLTMNAVEEAAAAKAKTKGITKNFGKL